MKAKQEPSAIERGDVAAVVHTDQARFRVGGSEKVSGFENLALLILFFSGEPELRGARGNLPLARGWSGAQAWHADVRGVPGPGVAVQGALGIERRRAGRPPLPVPRCGRRWRARSRRVGRRRLGDSQQIGPTGRGTG